MAKYDYRGAIHCHSTYSDGTGSIEEIMEAANEAGLDFVMMTDHDTMKPMQDGMEKWHGSCLLICGTEITPPTNHMIAFGEGELKDVESLKTRKPQEFIDAVNEQNWFGFLSHPDHGGTERFDVPPLKWEDWSVQNYAGLGVWDLQTDWQGRLDRDDFSTKVYTDFARHLTGPKEETIARWDDLCQRGRILGVGEIDNHNIKKEVDGQEYQVFPYETAFRTIQNHVLLDESLAKDYSVARKQILDAIRAGQFYISFDFWDDPTEFVFEIDNGETVSPMGGTVELGSEPTELVAMLPEDALINVFHNGKSIHEEEANEVLIEINEPGVYRLEAMRNDLTWILSNPIWVTGEPRQPEVEEEEEEEAAEVAEEEAPAEEAPAEEAPAEEAPAEDAPAEEAPAEDAPAEDAPAEDAPEA